MGQWSDDSTNPELDPNVTGDICAAIGKAAQLCTSRFKQARALAIPHSLTCTHAAQFGQLCSDSASGAGKLITATDLQGFWDLIMMHARARARGPSLTQHRWTM